MFIYVKLGAKNILLVFNKRKYEQINALTQ